MAVEQRSQHLDADRSITSDEACRRNKRVRQARQHTGNHDGRNRPINDLGEQHHRFTNRDAGTADEVPRPVRPVLGGEHVGASAIVDIDDGERRVDAHRASHVEREPKDQRGTARSTGTLDRRRVDGDRLDSEPRCLLEERQLSQILRSGVVRKKHSGMGRLLGRDRAVRLADRRRGRGQHHPPYACLGSRNHSDTYTSDIALPHIANTVPDVSVMQ